MGKFISFMLGIVAGALILFALYTRDKGDATVEQTVEEENVELTNEDLLEEYRTMLDEYQKVIQEQQNHTLSTIVQDSIPLSQMQISILVSH